MSTNSGAAPTPPPCRFVSSPLSFPKSLCRGVQLLTDPWSDCLERFGHIFINDPFCTPHHILACSRSYMYMMFDASCDS